MYTTTNNPPIQEEPTSETTSSSTSTTTSTSKAPLALPPIPTPSSEDQATTAASDTQNLNVNGPALKLDHLGPMVVNRDGSLARIGNWTEMSEIERRNTLRVLGKRNKERLEALKALEGQGDADTEKS